MNTPKMRGLKQIFSYLELYGNNKFLDGQKLEVAHLIGKNLQTRHNNFKGSDKENVSLACFRRLIMLFVFNGGKWGDEWQYQIGTQGITLTNPHDHTKPHPLFADWLMKPVTNQQSDERSYKITQYFGKDTLPDLYWNDLLDGVDSQQILQLLKNYLELEELDMDEVFLSPVWKFKRVKSWHWLAGVSSFNISWNTPNMKCFVKTNSGHVMQIKLMIEFTYRYETVMLIHGDYWWIYESDSPDSWVNNEYTSMDFIINDEKKTGWNYIDNIDEPVFLIHDCVKMDRQTLTKLPMDIKPTNVYTWVQNMLYYSNLIHEYKQTNPGSNFDCPCGPKYICIAHETCACLDCTDNKGEYPSDKWRVIWCCNKQKNGKMFVFEKKQGLVMTLMKPLPSVLHD